MINNIFGTDGIRAAVGQEPLTVFSLHKLGKAIARWALQKYQKNPIILLGHDTRLSCDFVKNSLKAGLLLYRVKILDGNVLTSPAISQIIAHSATIDCGIVISASHNPHLDNGIKIIDRFNGKLCLEDELLITRFYDEDETTNLYNNLGTEKNWLEAASLYKQTLLSFFKPNFLHGYTIVLDCAHGAAFQIAPDLFQELGATVITLHNEPNGYNINNNCGTLHPVTLQNAVVAHDADIGFAFDGDADRVIAVNKKGELKDGDDILVHLLDHPLYNQSKVIVGTVMSNQGLEIHLKNNDKTLTRTNVGDKYISSYLIENNLLLGGEPSGHIIARDYLNTGDGIFVALRILEAMIFSQNWNLVTFTKFPQIIINVPIVTKKDLKLEPFNQLIISNQNKLINGRLLVRYSGTELLLRIMIEDNDYNHAHYIGTDLAAKLSNALTE